MKKMQAVTALNLTMRFGNRTVFEGVNFSVQPGESMALIGPSGSGKSTILSCILGLQTPTRGQVWVGENNIAELNRKRRAQIRRTQIGMVFQHSELLDSLSALQNVLLPTMLHSSRDEGAAVRAHTLLEAVGLTDSATLAADLSGGERQRVALARALINQPRVILADEPTGALDTELRDSVADLLFNTVAEQGVALVIATHDPALSASADATYVLSEGEAGGYTP